MNALFPGLLVEEMSAMDERDAAEDDARRRLDEQKMVVPIWKSSMDCYWRTGDPDDMGLMFAISVEESIWLREACDGIK